MDILYHYCSTKAFYGIITSKSLWLSSLSQSNDYMEGKLITKTVERLADYDGLDKSAIELLKQCVTVIESTNEVLGFCLSNAEDLLSQWRGYAEDATGVSIGFSKEYLEGLEKTSFPKNKPFLLLKKVEYDENFHEEMVSPIYEEAKKQIQESRKSNTEVTFTDLLIGRTLTLDKIQRNFFNLVSKLYLFKSPAFKEEKEFRLMTHILDEQDSCKYRIRDKQLIAYQACELREIEREPIVRVILGPKHPTPVQVVKNFLRHNGFGEVEVIQSSATYR